MKMRTQSSKNFEFLDILQITWYNIEIPDITILSTVVRDIFIHILTCKQLPIQSQQ